MPRRRFQSNVCTCMGHRQLLARVPVLIANTLMRKVLFFFGLLIATYALLIALGRVGGTTPWFDMRQINSVGVFAMFIYGTLIFGEFRLAFAFGGIAVLMAGNLMTVQRFTQAASIDVITFLIGTFL